MKIDYKTAYENVMVANKMLEKEIERLKIIEEKYKDSQLYIKDFKDEIERLNNIIDELEHHLYQEWLEWKDSDCESIYSRAGEDKAIYDYLQELKENDKEFDKLLEEMESE